MKSLKRIGSLFSEANVALIFFFTVQKYYVFKKGQFYL